MEDIHIVTILKEHRNLIGLIREIVVHILKALHVSITKTNGITTDEGEEIQLLHKIATLAFKLIPIENQLFALELDKKASLSKIDESSEVSEITEDDIKILKRFLGVNYVNDNANEKGGE